MYTLRLSDAVRDRTFDELWDLIIWLPQGSAFAATFQAEGDTARARKLYGWSAQEEIGLNLLNLVQEQSWILAQSHSKTKIPIPQPVQGPHPVPVRKPDPKNNASAVARSLLDLQE